MRYVLSIGMIIVLSSCSWNRCEFSKGSRAFMGLEPLECTSDPLNVCISKCKNHLNTVVRFGNTTNTYSCSCDDK